MAGLKPGPPKDKDFQIRTTPKFRHSDLGAAKLLGCRYVLFYFSDSILEVNAVALQEGVHIHPRLETQHLANGGFGQPPCAVALQG
jgi:hypothetical protein